MSSSQDIFNMYIDEISKKWDSFSSENNRTQWTFPTGLYDGWGYDGNPYKSWRYSENYWDFEPRSNMDFSDNPHYLGQFHKKSEPRVILDFDGTRDVLVEDSLDKFDSSGLDSLL